MWNEEIYLDTEFGAFVPVPDQIKWQLFSCKLKDRIMVKKVNSKTTGTS